MSVDSTELRKSTLQRKDREELTAIATALGAKPSSRARKAEIVDLILETVSDGDEAPDADPDTDESGDDESTDEAAAADESTDEAAAPADPKGDAAPDQPEVGNRRRRRRGRGGERDTADQWDGEPIPVSGFLDLRDEGYGFLRTNGWVPSKDDAYVPVKMVRQFGLRRGDELVGSSRPANQNEKNPAILVIDSVNGAAPEASSGRSSFEALTPVPPTQQLAQERSGGADAITARVIDAVAPVAKGQRGIVVAPPEVDSLGVLASMARSIEANDPDVHVIVLLIDERPEDVIAMKRLVEAAEVQASTFDRPADEHVLVAEMTIERAKRMVEFGTDVCVLMNGITRLARAYDAVAPSSGRNAKPTPIDNWAVYQTKKFLGAARSLDEGGSLTLVTTARSHGSTADEIVLDQVLDTAGMVVRLDGWAAQRGIEPPVDLLGSGTRHLEALLEPAALDRHTQLRRALADAGDGALEVLLAAMADTDRNADLDPSSLG